MKKTITILLVLLVAAFAVFAATPISQIVNLDSSIAEATGFSYKLNYTGTGSAGTTVNVDTTVASATATESNFNPAVAGTVSFTLTHINRVNLLSAAGYEFDVNITDWIQLDADEDQLTTTNPNQVNETSLENFSGRTYNNNDNLHAVTVTAAETTNTHTFDNIKVDYAKGITEASTKLFSFDVKWVNDPNLEAGDYRSIVTLSYTAGD